MNTVASISKQEMEKSEQEKETKYRWAAEFMAGPGGYMEKAEIVSDWFTTFSDAKEDAFLKADKEMKEYPYSRGRILKLVVEDKNGVVVVLQNALDIPKR